jgi:hypothetical protein
MTEIEKLRVILPHWIEHNSSHEAEFVKWANIAVTVGNHEVADLIKQAVDRMREVDYFLYQALTKVGGQPDEGHAGHDHSHD